ncbi:MAG: hypothetical protein KF729_19695 [Sandaracinaceae bacterium]|nr:hypothetical protein [Sandaracinaceae bacterium]
MTERDFMGRVEELGGLHRELTAHVAEGRWRRAAELAGLLEIDLDELREALRARHREELRAARGEKQKDVLAKLRAGLPGARVRRWRAAHDAWTARRAET